MRFKQTHSVGSDETAPYDVFDFKTNVKEFVDEVLNRKGDWGKINFVGYGRPIEYKNGKLFEEIPEQVLNREIEKVDAVGGWSYMRYRVFLKVKYLTDEETAGIRNCLCCKHCLPPAQREKGMCKLNECKFEEA